MIDRFLIFDGDSETADLFGNDDKAGTSSPASLRPVRSLRGDLMLEGLCPTGDNFADILNHIIQQYTLNCSTHSIQEVSNKQKLYKQDVNIPLSFSRRKQR